MPFSPPFHEQKWAESYFGICGGTTSCTRAEAVKAVRLCVACQAMLSKKENDFMHPPLGEIAQATAAATTTTSQHLPPPKAVARPASYLR